MSLWNDEAGWGWPARLLHWAIAALILFMFGLGFWMTGFVADVYEQFALFQLHKSWGFVVFALALARILWRLVNRAPPLPSTMGPAERALAHLGHLALYGLMIAMPVTGWLTASASDLQDLYGIRNMVFGLFELWDPFVPGSKRLEDAFRTAHFWCGMLLLLTLAGHAGFALKHHFVERDNVLRRMILGR